MAFLRAIIVVLVSWRSISDAAICSITADKVVIVAPHRSTNASLFTTTVTVPRGLDFADKICNVRQIFTFSTVRIGDQELTFGPSTVESTYNRTINADVINVSVVLKKVEPYQSKPNSPASAKLTDYLSIIYAPKSDCAPLRSEPCWTEVFVQLDPPPDRETEAIAEQTSSGSFSAREDEAARKEVSKSKRGNGATAGTRSNKHKPKHLIAALSGGLALALLLFRF